MEHANDSTHYRGPYGEFARALRDAKAPVPSRTKLTAQKKPASKRFGVYRNNVLVSLVEAVADSYPVLVRLVGEEFFNAVARDYVRSGHFPKTPVLLNYGDDFPDFLADYAPVVSRLAYLPDVARLELAWRKSYHARDEHPASVEVLGQITPENADNYKLIVHPSVRLVSSDYPIYSIWQTNKYDDEVKPLSRNAGAETVLIVRPEFQVNVSILDDAIAVLLQACLDGDTLGEVGGAVLEQFPAFDLPAGLLLLFTNEVFTGVAFNG